MIHVISLGAGVQSTTMALMAKHGEITPMPDCAIFADTGSEPKGVYEHLEKLIHLLPFQVHIVRAWEGYGQPKIKAALGQEVLNVASGQTDRGLHSRPPFFTLAADGTKGMIRRQCTRDYKIEPIEKKNRELLGLRYRQHWPNEIMIEEWIGISTDEASRAKPITIKRGEERVPHPTIRARFPLLEVRMSRRDCMTWLTKHGYAIPPKSACTFCPFHSDAEWRQVKTDPAAWAEVVRLDEAIRNGLVSEGLDAAMYLHASRKPIAEVDFSTAEERGQLNLFENECEGMCGV